MLSLVDLQEEGGIERNHFCSIALRTQAHFGIPGQTSEEGYVMSLRAQGMSSTRYPKQDLRPSQCRPDKKRRRAYSSHTHTVTLQSHAHAATQSAALIGHPGHTRITVTIPAQRPNTHQTRRRTNSHGAHAHNVDVMITMYASPCGAQ